jgi:hypothetical protein
MLPVKLPGDLFPYARHPDSCRFHSGLPPAVYVYVLAEDEELWVLPDGPHQHPLILGGATPAAGAGELVLEENGRVVEVNNLSGTFQCGPETLSWVIEAIQRQGGIVLSGTSKPFAWEE